MGILTIIIGILVGGWQFDSIQKRIDKADADPYTTIHSDKWYKAHPEYKK